MKCVVVLYRENLRILRCIGNTEFCYSIDGKPRLSPWERAEPSWKASEGTRFAVFAAVREEEWAFLLCRAAYMHPHPHAAAPLPSCLSQFCSLSRRSTAFSQTSGVCSHEQTPALPMPMVFSYQDVPMADKFLLLELVPGITF